MADRDLMSRITVRDVTHDDFEAVMKMASTDTFRDGFDYLPAKFHRYVDDPDTLFVVAEVDGEMAAILVTYAKDDERTSTLKTARMAPSWAGRRAAKKIFMAIGIYAMSSHYRPYLRSMHGMTDVHHDTFHHLVSNWSPSYFNNIRIEIMYFSCDVSTWSDNMETADLAALPTVAPYQAADMARLMSPHFLSTVRSKQYIFVDWDPYKLSESSMKKFVEEGCYILVDQTKAAAKSLSFGGSYMTPRGRVYHIDVHCRDEALCKAHIINHVKNACSKYTGLITFGIMVIDQALKEAVMKYCVEDLALSHLPHDHTYVFGDTDFSNVTGKVKSKY